MLPSCSSITEKRMRNTENKDTGFLMNTKRSSNFICHIDSLEAAFDENPSSLVGGNNEHFKLGYNNSRHRRAENSRSRGWGSSVWEHFLCIYLDDINWGLKKEEKISAYSKIQIHISSFAHRRKFIEYWRMQSATLLTLVSVTNWISQLWCFPRDASVWSARQLRLMRSWESSKGICCSTKRPITK